MTTEDVSHVTDGFTGQTTQIHAFNLERNAKKELAIFLNETQHKN